MRVGVVALALHVASSVPASAEWQIKPFLGTTFSGDTTLFDPQNSASGRNVIVGVSGELLGEVIGVEGDLGIAPGFFTDGLLILGSRVTTLTGNIVVAMPRRMARYTLRPYFVGGAGFMRASSDTSLDALPITSTRPAVDLGGGVTGFLSKRVGINWDVRHFGSVGTGQIRGQSIGPEQLSFWRASVGLAIRY